MNAKERLVTALTEAGAPDGMISKAKRGWYDDFESEIATPIMDLVRDCREAGLNQIAERAKKGEFDA